MEFISAEEFLKQDKEVQEVFINWWKPERGDLFQYNYGYGNIEVINIKSIKEDVKESKYSAHIIPLLTEGHLRKFIEDKTRCYFSCEIINPLVNEEGFRFVFEFYSGKEFKYNEKLRKEIYAIDLLHAYWKVVCEIAKESIKK